MADRLSLHQLTALDAAPVELVALAGQLGCAHVTLFTHVPERARGFYPCVGPEDVPAMQDALAAAGVTVCNLEVFPLDQDGGLDRFAEGLRVGAALGAPRATVHLHEFDDRAIAVRRLREFCAVAADHGIVPGLEFNGFSAVKDIATAVAIVREAGCGAVALDVLHLMRNGADIGAVAENADLISYAQVCDGPLQLGDDPAAAWREAVSDRGLPGTGDFPLADILRPVVGHAVIEAEIPQSTARKAGIDALERARRAIEAVRKTVESLA